VRGFTRQQRKEDVMTTSVGTQRDLSTLIEQLIELDYDAIEAYDAVVDRLQSPECRAQMIAFRDDHARHVRDLGAILRQSGREPPGGPDVKRLLTQGKVVIAGLMGDKAVLMAMKTNEDDTNTAYERSVSNDVVPPQVKDTLRACLADERRHRAWIEDQLSRMS
jgi:uncharacterized protein (TIGR02284 family)